MSMILAETYITRATQQGRLRTGEVQGNLCRPSFQAGFSGTYRSNTEPPRRVITHTIRRVSNSVAETDLQLSLPEHSFRHGCKCSCCSGTNRDSAPHRTRHTHTLAHSHAVTLRWMGAGPCRFCRVHGVAELEAGHSTLSDSPRNAALFGFAGVTHMEAQRRRGIEPGRGDP